MDKIFEIDFNGTPENFLEMASNYGEYHSKDTYPYQWIANRISRPIMHLVCITSGPMVNTKGYIRAQALPKSMSKLIVCFPEEKWFELGKYWDMLHEEMIRQGWIETPGEPKSEKSDNKIKIPKRKLDLERWKKVYSICQETRKNMKEQYENGSTSQPKPSYPDYSDAIAMKMSERLSERTIERILAAGDSGLLDSEEEVESGDDDLVTKDNEEDFKDDLLESEVDQSVAEDDKWLLDETRGM